MLRKLTLFTLLLSSLFLVACGEPAEREAKYVERAKAFYEKGDYERATIELSNAQQINPEGIESTYYQGLIKEAEGDLSGALWRFQTVYERDPTHLRAVLKIGNIFLITNMLDDAQEMAERASEIAPGDADLGALKAGIALRRENTDEAKDLAEAVLANDPAHIAAAGILARIFSDRGETGRALQVLDSAIQLNPENQNLRRVKILLHLENGDLPSAEKVYFELFALAPEFLDYRKELVRHYIAYGRLDDGEMLLRNLVAEFPTEIEPKQLLVDFLLNQRSFSAAEQEMLNFLAEDPENDELRLDLAGIYSAQGLRDKAEAVYLDVLQGAGSDKAVVL
ncbi:MAG TPA: tetratricopeptide repeat protein, partial [Kiloniellaceae bacterium]|nr:tetratricopeptide repeat protein [Kiloniellaceae bacterium]